jgi:hypothetical protein
MNNYSKNKRNRKDEFVRTLFVQIVIGIVALGMNSLSFASGLTDEAQAHEITVYKSPQCGCCSKWVDHLEESGFKVEVRTVDDTGSVKRRVGVPDQFRSCHTAIVGDYWVEGHVPADLIQKLLADQSDDIKGIAVPGMPLGSPGMEAPNPMEYEVLSVDGAGNVAVYATRMGKCTQ